MSLSSLGSCPSSAVAPLFCLDLLAVLFCTRTLFFFCKLSSNSFISFFNFIPVNAWPMLL